MSSMNFYGKRKAIFRVGSVSKTDTFSLLRAAGTPPVTIQDQNGANAETGDGAAGGRAEEIGGKEAKPPEILRRYIEDTSKYHRRSIVTSRLHHPYHTPATRSQQA